MEMRIICHFTISLSPTLRSVFGHPVRTQFFKSSFCIHDFSYQWRNDHCAAARSFTEQEYSVHSALFPIILILLCLRLWLSSCTPYVRQLIDHIKPERGAEHNGHYSSEPSSKVTLDHRAPGSLLRIYFLCIVCPA